MKTPILFLIFNRHELTSRTFQEIRKNKPEQLFIAADGPRKNDEEKELCKKTRGIIDQIDWNCELKTLFRDENLGCKLAVSSAIDWFFEHVEEGIILEDDCLPNDSFFIFCEELLSKYRSSEEIMHISGSNLQFGEKFGNGSYYFSYCPHVWGWATWKRAWSKYDLGMSDLDNFIKLNKANKLFRDKRLSIFWNSLFKHTRDKNIDTWDVQWNYSILNNKGLSITPNSNLIRNIGFGANATHTKEVDSNLVQESQDLDTIDHPSDITPNLAADYQIYKKVYFRSIFDKIKFRLKSFLKY